jgi:cell division protein FtsB
LASKSGILARTLKKRRPPADAIRTAPRRRRRAVQYLLVFVGAVLVVDAVVGEKGLLAMMQARQEYTVLEQSVATARAENARLREEARRLREDPTAIEDIARRELGLIRRGEKLFIVRDVVPAPK